MPFHDWEKTPNFDPAKISVNSPRWVNYKGSLLTEAQEMADNAHISQDFISSVVAGEAFADASFLAFHRSPLKEAKIDEGETLQGFRSGSAITLAMSGSQLADVMSHVGWSNTGTALYYMKLAEVLREGSPSDLLSSNELAASASTTLYADLNRLKDFVSAFPRS